MNENKHTPGPWVADGGRSILATPGDRIGQDFPDWTRVATIEARHDHEVTRANAALIAAAPELYRLLYMLLVRMDAEAKDMKSRGEPPIFLFGAMREDVRTALAKAEGR